MTVSISLKTLIINPYRVQILDLQSRRVKTLNFYTELNIKNLLNQTSLKTELSLQELLF